MTNEQLALLLSNYHLQLVGIFNQLCAALKDTEGIEYHQIHDKWIGEGEKPQFSFLLEYSDREDWTWKDGKNIICLDDLSEFVDDLEQNVKDLLG